MTLFPVVSSLKFLKRKKAWCFALPLIALMAVVTPAQNFNSLVNFDGSNGADPTYVALTQGIDGNFYGTTAHGGANNFSPGTVFRMTTAGILTTVYNFCALTNCADGYVPYAGLTLALDGNFYGTTTLGGTYNIGTVFKITPDGVLTPIHSFNGLEGAYPYAPLVQAADENFYGTTSAGGDLRCRPPDGCGTVFKTSPRGKLTKLHSFCTKTNCPDGEAPYAGLVQADDGNFYGTTLAGGSMSGVGTVFRITPEGELTTLYTFCPGSEECPEGLEPYAGLVQGTDGGLYGTTIYGGVAQGAGTIFQITTEGQLTTLYTFCSSGTFCTDGANPAGGLIQATDGNFYGTTYHGSGDDCTLGCGTIYEFVNNSGVTVLHSFNDYDGAYPQADLIQGTDGNFYGTTSGIGYNDGTAFSLSTGLAPFVAFVRSYGKVGQTGGILGQGFTGTASVYFNGMPAIFTILSDTYITATVPAGAATGYVTVTTPSGILKSNAQFRVIK